MGVLKRSKDIIDSNINAVLDRVEEPDKMIRLMIREMEDALSSLKASCAAKVSESVRNKQEIEYCGNAVKRWTERSVLAVKEKKDDLAKEALIEKKKAESKKALLENDLEHLETIIGESKNHIREIEEKLKETIQKQYILIQRGIHAKETLQVNRTIRQAGSTDTVFRFNELEKRIERMEAEAELSGISPSSVKENTFQDLENDRAIEEELQALKKSGNSGASK
jgi:phage shock protein A